MLTQCLVIQFVSKLVFLQFLPTVDSTHYLLSTYMLMLNPNPFKSIIYTSAHILLIHYILNG